MGEPKMLLPWGSESVISHLVRTWECLGAAEVAVVMRDGDDAIRGELEKRNLGQVRLIVNPFADGGMFGSVQCAARWEDWSPALTHFGVVLGDQPHLRVSTLRRLLSALESREDQIVQPSHKGRPRHPVFLSTAAFVALRKAPFSTLKDFLSTGSWRVRLVEIDDEALNCDIDTVQDYRRMLAKFNSGEH